MRFGDRSILLRLGSPHVPTQLQRGAKMSGRNWSQVSPENRLRVWVMIGGTSYEWNEVTITLDIGDTTAKGRGSKTSKEKVLYKATVILVGL